MLLKTGNLLQCSGAELYFASLIFIIITLSAAIGRESLQVETVKQKIFQKGQNCLCCVCLSHTNMLIMLKGNNPRLSIWLDPSRPDL